MENTAGGNVRHSSRGRIYQSLFCGLSLIVLLIGCAPNRLGRPFIAADPPTSNRARLYVYRLDEFPSGGSARVQLAGQTIGRLENEEFLDLEIALGKHDISIFYYQFPFSFDWGDLSLQAIAGETYYLRLRLVRVQPRPLGYFAKSDEEPIAGRYKVNLLRDFRVPEMARREIEQTRRTQ